MNRRNFVKGLAAFTAATMVGGALIDTLPKIPKTYHTTEGVGTLAQQSGYSQYESLTEEKIREIVSELTYKYFENMSQEIHVYTGKGGYKLYKRNQRRERLEYWINKIFKIR